MRRNIVNGKATDDHVDAVVVERQRGHVAGVQFDAVGDVLQIRVGQGGRRRVVGLVGLPQVDADGAPAWQPLGRGQQDGAAAAAHVQHSLVALQLQVVEYPI